MKKLIWLFIFILCFTDVSFAQKNKKDKKESKKDEWSDGYQGGKIENLITPKDALNFLAVGDWGRNGEYNQQKVADRMGEAAKQMDAEFVISLGDNFYPNGVASPSDYHFTASFEQIYKAHALMVDWYVVLGNHDYRGNPQAQIEYSHISRRWKMPARYYSFEKELEDEGQEKVLFVFLDTSPFEKKYYKEDAYKKQVSTQDTTAQKVWLNQVLKESKAKWKIVIGHHPIYSSGKRLKETGDIQTALEGILEKYKVDAYFAGHEHDLQHNQAKTVHHFISGAGSEIRPTGTTSFTKFSKSEHGFMTVSLNSNQLLVQVIDHKGNTLYKTTINK